MPRKYTIITPQIVEKVRKYLDDDRGFSKKEVARLVGISDHSVARIVQGYYDQPVEKPKAKQSVDSEFHGNVTQIPYEKLEYLIKCETFVDELFDTVVLSDKNEDEVYFPRRYTSNMLNRYFPVKFQECLEKLHSDTNA